LAIDEQQHVALPKLYGAPAYARPPRVAGETPRPIDPDDLPITAFQTDEERELAERLLARSYVGTPDDANGRNGKHAGRLQPRPFRLKALAGRFLRGS
jgi:hypothetical protein